MKLSQLHPRYIQPYDYPIDRYLDDMFWVLHYLSQDVIYGSFERAETWEEIEDDYKHFKFLRKYKL